MAHTCPSCGCYCTCSGDWDDMDFGQQPRGGCKHYKSPDCGGDDDDDVFDDEYYEEWKKFDHIPAEGGNKESK